MPKKINSHGNMQEYIPAGNGDASGEYGNSDGSNKHFTNFKQPKKVNPLKVDRKDVEQVTIKTNRGIYHKGYPLNSVDDLMSRINATKQETFNNGANISFQIKTKDGNVIETETFDNIKDIKKYFSNFKEKPEKPNKYIEQYVSGDTMYLNNYLRNDEPLDDEEKKIVEELDQATQHTIKKDKLYRSVDAKSVFGNLDWQDYDNLVALLGYGESSFDKGEYSQNQLKKAKDLLQKIENKEITEKGYMSTTKDRNIALNWGGFSGSEMPMVLEIETNPNTKGYDVSKFYEVDDDKQEEVLLSRNQRYKIKDVDYENGNIYAKVELL